jgi:mono/diheme cytochrome c family protein
MRKIVRLNLTLAAALVVCVLLILNSGRDLSQPNVEYMPNMAYSHAYETFSRNAVFRDGVTLQRPPEGAIARGKMPLRYEATVEDALRAGAQLHSSIDMSDAAVLRRGAEIYGAFCQPCHGATGRGDGPIAARGFPPPPSLLSEKVMQLGDGQIFHIISYGQANMPAHGTQILPGDRWGTVAHVRRLQERAMASQATADSAGTGES